MINLPTAASTDLHSGAYIFFCVDVDTYETKFFTLCLILQSIFKLMKLSFVGFYLAIYCFGGYPVLFVSKFKLLYFLSYLCRQQIQPVG